MSTPVAWRCPVADHTGTKPPRQRVSVVNIMFAFIFLTIASVGLTGDPWWLLNQGTKWVAVGVLAMIGLALVLTSLPGNRRQRN